MSVRISVDDAAMQAGFDRLSDTGAATAALEKVLSAQFQAGQQAVHVITGSLRASEEIDSDYTGGRWAGQVSFGGTSPGYPNDPVVYAAYEAARGGPHDFGTPIAAIYPRYRTAMRDHLAKGAKP